MGMHIPSSLTSQKEQQISKSLDLASLSTSQWPGHLTQSSSCSMHLFFAIIFSGLCDSQLKSKA